MKLVVALKQMAEQTSQPGGAGGTFVYNTPDNGNPGGVQEGDTPSFWNSGDNPEDGKRPPDNSVSSRPNNTHFFMSASLDNTRINRDVQRLVEEVISHLAIVDGARVDVSLEVTGGSTWRYAPNNRANCI